jgi:acyl-coenzyme A thioesterase PaaI-like protein
VSEGNDLRRLGRPGSLIAEIGMLAELVGDEIRGRAPVVPEMLVPGTDCLRMSLLAAWADTLIGFQSIAAVAPRVPVTLDLSVDLHRLPRGVNEVTTRTRVLKAGSSMVTAELDFQADGEPIGLAMAAFTVGPHVSRTLPPVDTLVTYYSSAVSLLEQPYAERAGCIRTAPGVAELAMAPDKVNAAGTMNGGLIALAVEEAALSTAPDAALRSLTMRYLRSGRIGPFVATAERTGDLARIDVRDAGNDNRVVIAAIGRFDHLDR